MFWGVLTVVYLGGIASRLYLVPRDLNWPIKLQEWQKGKNAIPMEWGHKKKVSH